MPEPNASDQSASPESFRTLFERLVPLIVAEWPSVPTDALRATDGAIDDVVKLVAEKTDHTKALVRAKLDELVRVVKHGTNGHRSTAMLDDQMTELLERLEKRTADLAGELRSELLPKARKTVTENLVVSLLVTLGLGFLLGVIFALGARRGR